MNKNILIIDDEEMITASLRKLLTHQGYTVETANDVGTGLNILKKSNIDLIISDVRMPGVDGVEGIQEVRRTLKKMNKSPVPEILITGYADLEKYEQAANLKVAAYVYKPFDNKSFCETVDKILKA